MRSLLFVPAHDERKLAKGLGSDADALIVDLEDAVPVEHKARARAMAAEFVTAHSQHKTLFVRVNDLASGLLLEDLAALVRARPAGIMLPKCEGGNDLALLDAYLSALEVREGMAPGAVKLLPIVTETAQSLFNMSGYKDVAGRRLCGMLWGGEDLAADIGANANRADEGHYTEPYMLARSMTLLAATTAKVPAIDAVYSNFRDGAGLLAEATSALRDGFTAKAAIHPDQIAAIHAAFTPDEATVRYATRVVEAFHAAPGLGAIALDGKMLTTPYLRSAQGVLRRAGLQPSPAE
jgi:citrate lyase subunit beta/citryl-CoA lyase